MYAEQTILGKPGVTHSAPTVCSEYGMGHAWVRGKRAHISGGNDKKKQRTQIGFRNYFDICVSES